MSAVQPNRIRLTPEETERLRAEIASMEARLTSLLEKKSIIIRSLVKVGVEENSKVGPLRVHAVAAMRRELNFKTDEKVLADMARRSSEMTKKAVEDLNRTADRLREEDGSGTDHKHGHAMKNLSNSAFSAGFESQTAHQLTDSHKKKSPDNDHAAEEQSLLSAAFVPPRATRSARHFLRYTREPCMLRLVIQSFADKVTEDFFHGRPTAATRRIPKDIRKRLTMKLDGLNAAATLEDLAAMPANRLEALSGKMKGLHSVRVNNQWRIVFRWTAIGPSDVRWSDYH